MSSPIDIKISARRPKIGFGRISWLAALRLGRVSNIPTVWTNVLAGIVLSGAPVAARPTIFLLLSLSVFYVAGMFLNDAYDCDLDANNRPDRPIPAGDVAAATVFAYGFALLACGFGLLLALAYPITADAGWQAPAGDPEVSRNNIHFRSRVIRATILSGLCVCGGVRLDE